MNETQVLVEKITEGIQEKKGKNIIIADLTGIEDTICKYFIICQGNSPSQVLAITDSVKDYVKKSTGEKVYAIDAHEMPNGWLWIMETSWYTFSCRKCGHITNWRIFGLTPN